MVTVTPKIVAKFDSLTFSPRAALFPASPLGFSLINPLWPSVLCPKPHITSI